MYLRLLASLWMFAPAAALAEGLPRMLVDGFAGWEPLRHAESWSLEDGTLTLVSDPAREGSTLWTVADYGDFIVELEFHFDEGTIDSGVFLRREGDQIQVGTSNSLKRDLTGSPYIAGKGYPVEAERVAELLKLDGWNAMKIVAVGADYDVWVNGEHVMHYRSETAIERGPIGLQIHPGNAMRMRYRNVRLAELQ